MSVAAIGIDAGSTTTKLVAVDAVGTSLWHLLEDTDPRMEVQTRRLVAAARERAGDAATPVVATGYGRKLVAGATRRVTEITCHARGVFWALGHGGTLVDIGGQDAKVIVIGPAGDVVSFAMNDKCAAGTGRFLEVVAGRLKVGLDALPRLALAGAAEVPISSTCTVFAESEMISKLAHGEPLEAVVRGLVRALVRRVASMARANGLVAPVMLSGGVARSEAMRRLLGEELGQPVEIPDTPQLMGAYGAALTALR